MAPRDDYERFKKTFPDAFKDKYEVGEFSLNKEWSRPYIRVWDKSSRMKSTNLNDVETGVFVDVFPIDGLPNGAFARKVFYMKAAVLVGLGNAAARTRFLDGEKHKVIKTLASVIARPFGKRFFTTQLEKLACKYPFYKSEYVAASMASHYGEKETILRSLMSSPVFQEFEGRAFPIPSGYDTYLSNLYGNYMEIPKDAAEKGYTHLDHYEFGQAETSE